MTISCDGQSTVPPPTMRSRAYICCSSRCFPRLFYLTCPGSQDRAAFLNALSSSPLLCLAYNAGVRQSRKPWGYINTDSIHDIISLEAAVTKYQRSTGRKKRNGAKASRSGVLTTCVCGTRKSSRWPLTASVLTRPNCRALRIHCMLPIISPATPDVPTLKPSPTSDLMPPSPSSSKFSEPSILFGARVVARRDNGWEDMLERILFRWILAVVEE